MRNFCRRVIIYFMRIFSIWLKLKTVSDFPIERFSILGSRNPSNDVFEQHKIPTLSGLCGIQIVKCLVWLAVGNSNMPDKKEKKTYPRFYGNNSSFPRPDYISSHHSDAIQFAFFLHQVIFIDGKIKGKLLWNQQTRNTIWFSGKYVL